MSQPELNVVGAPCLQYEFDGLTVNVWTDIYNGRRTIEGIALPGSKVDLSSMLTKEQMEALRQYCELKLSTAEEMAYDDREDQAYQRKRDRELA